MENKLVKVKLVRHLTHDVLQIVTERPAGFDFVPGQATEISINKTGWTEKTRPFSFTNLPDDDFLQFVIKTYPVNKGVTNELLQLKQNDELILHDVFGSISYSGEGCFIAGGAGITPFLSILRHLKSKKEIGRNKLIFANKTADDIILKQELEDILGPAFINILSNDNTPGFHKGFITEEFLKSNIDDLNKTIYVCGPPPMMVALFKILASMGVDKENIIKETV